MKRPKLVALSAVLIAMVGIGIYIWAAPARHAGSFLGCLRGKGCDGIDAISGSQKISEAQLTSIMRLPEVAKGAALITQARIIRSGDASNLMLIADVGRGPQMFPVTMISSPDGPKYSLGPLVLKLLSMSIQNEDHTVQKSGQLYELLSARFTNLGPSLSQLGVSKLELSGGALDLEEVPGALLTLAENNKEMPLRVFRP